MIRFFDILFSFFGLILLLPFFIIISLLILLDSKGPVLFLQRRVGKNNRDFRLIKFRTMRPGAEKAGSLTIGEGDTRITRTGRFLRKYKLDELPQLVNVLKGEMSFVGPRPEVRKYVDLYTEEQKKVLAVRPGITDFASIEYINENEILGHSPDPEKTYIEKVMPEKIRINMRFINSPGIRSYLTIIGKTLRHLIN
jgi:lipopolysaccharide/colanic/teichoic acid biosynthesis glycosyltransferase